MPRPLSKIAPAWWDFTTLDPSLLQDAAKLSARDLLQLARPGFQILIYDTLEEFFLAEALEYLRGVGAIDAGQSRGHLRADRADGTVAAGRAAGQRTGRGRAARAFLGNGRVGRRRRQTGRRRRIR